VKQLAQALPKQVWSEVACGEGSKGTLQSRFTAVAGSASVRRRSQREPAAGTVVADRVAEGTDEPSAYWLIEPTRENREDLFGISNIEGD